MVLMNRKKAVEGDGTNGSPLHPRYSTVDANNGQCKIATNGEISSVSNRILQLAFLSSVVLLLVRFRMTVNTLI